MQCLENHIQVSYLFPSSKLTYLFIHFLSILGSEIEKIERSIDVCYRSVNKEKYPINSINPFSFKNMDSFLEALKNTVEALGARYEFDAEEAMADIDMTPFEELLKAKKPAGRPKKTSVEGGGGSSDSTEEDPEKEAKRLAKNAAAKAKREAAKAAKANDPTMAPKKAPSKKKISSESLDAAKKSGATAAAAIVSSASASASDSDAKPKRVLSEEQKEKMRLGRERKKAEKEALAAGAGGAAGTV